MTEKLDKLAITNYDSHDPGLENIGVMPNSNQFALEGSNPMWKTEPVNLAEDNIRQVLFTVKTIIICKVHNKKQLYFVVGEAVTQTL